MAQDSGFRRIAPRLWALPLLFLLGVPASRAQTLTGGSYQEVYYSNGKLRLQAYLYKPQGSGPFPVVIYNHAARAGGERTPTPYIYVGTLLRDSGYVVLVPERRGFGRSEGQVFREFGDTDPLDAISRMQDETSDVLSALDFLKTLPYADTSRVAMMGWSLGGMVTIFAASQSTGLRAAIDQAGGALHWGEETAMRLALVRAASKINIPILAMAAENDRTESVRVIVQELERRKVPAKLIIYPRYRPPGPPRPIPAGHLIFDAPGVHIWANDVLAFLAANLAGTK